MCVRVAPSPRSGTVVEEQKVDRSTIHVLLIAESHRGWRNFGSGVIICRCCAGFEDWASNFTGPLRRAIGQSPSTFRRQQVAKLAYEIWEKNGRPTAQPRGIGRWLNKFWNLGILRNRHGSFSSKGERGMDPSAGWWLRLSSEVVVWWESNHRSHALCWGSFSVEVTGESERRRRKAG